MPSYLVESYLSRRSAAELDELAARAHLAAEAIAREGTPVRHLRCTYVPEDELCLLLFEAPSPEAVDEAATRARISYERIVEVVDPAGVSQRSASDRSRSREGGAMKKSRPIRGN